MEIKIRLKSPMLSIRNGLIIETHSVFPPGETNETVDYGIKSIANNIACTISPFSLLGWLRSGITEYLISQGISPCHSFDITNIGKSNQDYVNYAVQDLKHGYHKKRLNKGEHKEEPECQAIKGEQCIVSKMFGGFTGHHRVFSLMPVKVTPVQSNYDKAIKNITGKGNYRNIAISPRSAVDGTPFATHSVDAIANLDAVLFLKMYDDNPLFVAMIMRGIEYLSQNYEKFNHQLGGNRTFGCGFIEPTFMSPTLTRDETIEYHNLLIKQEDGLETEIVTNIENKSKQKGLSDKIKEKISLWSKEQIQLNTLLDTELKHQKDLFGIDKKWWNQEI